MPLHPETELAGLLAQAKIMAIGIAKRKDFVEWLPGDAKDAIAAHTAAIEDAETRLAELRATIAEKMKTIDAEKSAPAESPEQETEITPS